ncbi:MAG TPA: TolC family protein, partial [Longimicrobiaceae bacterium]|nr:TolC family protein [Longimicrobiaceae bacterium]
MRYALVVLALALATPAGAQTEPLTLARALDLAREHSPALHAAAGQVTAATGAARERAAPVNPSLELRREHWASPLDRDHFATLSLPLDVTLRRNALRAAGREDVAAAGADAAAARLDVEAGVASAYHAAALATELADAAAAQAEALEGIAAFEATRLREGAVAEAVA